MNFKKFWNKLSYIGLDQQSDEFSNREVVILNKMAFAASLSMLIMIPFEIYINGWLMVPYEIGMACFAGFSLVLNHFKKFTLSKYYFFTIANSLILLMGVAVGKGSGNEYFFIALFTVPLILFNDLKQILLLSFIVLALFYLLTYLQSTVQPVFDIPLSAKEKVQPIFAALIFILLFLGVFYFKSINIRFQSLLALKNQEIESKNREIIDSINYAKRIQDAILPPMRMLKQFLPQSFILYKPKDIVAGDFYWVEHVNDTVLFAVADCTGHGVPGAMVSVVCNNALNKSVREFELTKPNEILNKTRALIIEQFEKSDEDVKDGMDIALCSLNTTTKELQYAGANNPLWLIRKNSSVIEEIKPDKQPIGKHFESKPFTNHILSLQEGDLFFIFSDGYADQFGGSAGKKLKYKALKNILLRIHSKPLEQQKAIIEQEFTAWKGNHDQVDDVCLMGVRV